MTIVLPISTKFCARQFGSGNTEFTNLRVQDKRGVLPVVEGSKLRGNEWSRIGRQR